jgi:uncharacterized membrane protein YdbT with pleckstrin-like domain
MSYIEDNLMKGENLVYSGKLHWIVFIWPAIFFFVGITFSFDSVAVGGLFFFFAAITGIPLFINYMTSEFGITNKRVIVKVGFIRRNSIEILLNKVEAIQVNQNIWGRILGFGSIRVSGTGGTIDPFHNIDAPFEFRKQAQEQISAVQDSK